MLFTQPANLTRIMHTNPSNEENGKLFELAPVGNPDPQSCNKRQNQDPGVWNEHAKDLKVSLNNNTRQRSRRSPHCCVVSKQIDRVSRALFPCMWVAYNLIYWHKYVISAD